MTDCIVHPEMGELRWENQYSWWFTQIRLPPEEWLDVVIDPGEEDRVALLERATELFRWAMAAQGRILREATKAELLELYNDVWRQDDEPVLTAEELTKHLEWTYLRVSASEVVPVCFSYHGEDLFGGHSVDVKVGQDLRFRGIGLVG